MINKNKFLLQINFDQEAQNEEEVKDDNKKLNNNKPFESKFQSNAMTKGMFFNAANQDQQYEVVTIPQPKKQHSQKVQSKASQKRSIRLINEIEYGSDDNQNQQKTSSQKQEKKQQKVQIERQIEQPQPQRLINNNFRQNLLEIVLSDDDNSSKVTSEGSCKQEEQQYKIVQSKIQKKKQSKYAPKGRLNYEQLLEGVEDMNAFSRKFSRQLIQPKQILSLLIIRQNSGLNAIWPKFQFMFWDTTKQILYCKKMMGSSTSNYYITTEEGIQNVEHLNFISKMRSNFSGSAYQIYDNGVNPQKAGNGGKVRQIQASIRFKSQIISLSPRTFEVFVLKPGVKYFDLDLQYSNSKQEVGLQILYDKQQNRDKIFYFKNRLPVYSEEVKGYILNFGGRVHVPSAKNFILEDHQTNQQVLMMGKKSDELFRVDISWPLSPFIAACICLANFDSKFISE